MDKLIYEVELKLVKNKAIRWPVRKIQSPRDGHAFFSHLIEDADREKMLILCMNTKNQPIAYGTVHIGTINSSIMHPREILKFAIMSNAASIMISHNHPSGDPSPSQEDVNVTLRVKEAFDIVGINLLDHIIVGDKSYVSLKNKGII